MNWLRLVNDLRAALEAVDAAGPGDRSAAHNEVRGKLKAIGRAAGVTPPTRAAPEGWESAVDALRATLVDRPDDFDARRWAALHVANLYAEHAALAALAGESVADEISAVGKAAGEIAALARPGKPAPVTFELADVPDDLRPVPILSTAPEGADNHDGAVLFEGEVALVGGAGGVGKSALFGDLALLTACDAFNASPPFPMYRHGLAGPVVIATYEDPLGWLAEGMRLRLAGPGLGSDAPTREGIHLVDMAGRPLFGPGERAGNAGLYNARPEPLDGQRRLCRIIDRVRPRVVFVDPGRKAYTGADIAVAIAEFADAMIDVARGDGSRPACGIVLAVHSTKEPDLSPFDRKQIGGTGAWTDSVRAALTLAMGGGTAAPLAPGCDRTLAVIKANMGRKDIWVPLAPVREFPPNAGRFIGFDAGQRKASPVAEWLARAEWKGPPKGKANGAGKRNKANGAGDDTPETAPPDIEDIRPAADAPAGDA